MSRNRKDPKAIPIGTSFLVNRAPLVKGMPPIPVASIHRNSRRSYRWRLLDRRGIGRDVTGTASTQDGCLTAINAALQVPR
jgi:hypothetical protein